MDSFVRCPRCWKHTPAGAQYCPRCGASLSAARAAVPVAPPIKPAGGGLTALLLFLVMGAFGLMIMLFVATTTHAPVFAPPAPVDVTPAPPMSPDGMASQDDRPDPSYLPRWDDNGHVRVPPPPVRHMYPVRPRVIYPPDSNPSRERDRESHR